MGTTPLIGRKAPRVATYETMLKRPVVAGDIGGTNIRLAIVKNGSILQQRRVDMSRVANHEQLVSLLSDGINALLSGDRPKGLSICIGFPCPVKNNEIDFQPPNISYEIKPTLAADLQRITEIPVIVKNDAGVAVWGEALHGAGRGYDLVFWHGAGTGYGYAWIEGTEERFPDSSEGGHAKVVNPLDRNARPCGCDSKGCIETIFSGPGITTTLQELSSLPWHPLRWLGTLGKGLAAEQVAEMHATGNWVEKSLAQDTLRFTAQHFAMALATQHVMTLNSQSIHIIGGGVAQIGEPFLQAIRNAVQEPGMLSWPKSTVSRSLPQRIVFSELGDDAGLIGAAAYATFQAGMYESRMSDF